MEKLHTFAEADDRGQPRWRRRRCNRQGHWPRPGQFIAALNASKNQGVAFADLQQAMVPMIGGGLGLSDRLGVSANVPFYRATSPARPPPAWMPPRRHAEVFERSARGTPLAPHSCQRHRTPRLA